MKTPPWTLAQRDAAVLRGPHKSSQDFITFLRDELADMVDRATWVVLPYRSLRLIPNLRISPMGVVPQHERRPRPIVDYSFSGVNADTVPLAPHEAMQFGRALERIIRLVVLSNPRFGPVQFLKLDIADGFYRVWLRVCDVPTLAVSIPTLPGEEPLLALPLALPMGWTQSPPAFCAVTETIADMANHRLRLQLRHPGRCLVPPHRLDNVADTAPPPAAARPSLSLDPTLARDPLLTLYHRPTQVVDVFVDDFIGVAQGNTPALSRVRRTLMHTIDDVFRPLTVSDPPHRTEPISVSKLSKGDGAWCTTKQILGWTIDSEAMTLTLPPRRLARLQEILGSIAPARKRLSLDLWYQLLGELRSMALALPGARGLFSHLQAALGTRKGSRLRLTPSFHQALQDFRFLVSALESRPTSLYELVPATPTLIGTHDASGHGAGGVWFPHATAQSRHAPCVHLLPGHVVPTTGPRLPLYGTPPPPVVWRVRFPPDVSSSLRTFNNPAGTINNSELELAGGFWHDEVAAQCFDVRHRTLKSHTDNLATLFWHRKGSVTTTSPTATLLRQRALHQRFHRYLSLKDYLPGPLNTMADDASRLWTLSDAAFLLYFNATYPQAQPWTLFHPAPLITSSVISALRKRTCPTASFLLPPPLRCPTGPCGPVSVPNSPSILPWKTSPIPSRTFKSSPSATAAALSTPPVDLSAAAPWRVPYAALAKRSRVWGPLTRASPHKATSTSASNASSARTPAKMTRLPGSSRFPYPSSSTSWHKPSSRLTPSA